MLNKHSQPTQCSTGHNKPAIVSSSAQHSQQEGLRPPSYYSDTKRVCDSALAKAQARVRFAEYTDDYTPTKAQGTSTPTKPVPSAFRYIASRRICDAAGKRASILRQLEAVEERKLQTAKKNKIPKHKD